MAHFDIGNRLAIYGYKGEPEDFFHILAITWWRDYYGRFNNVERLLYHPTRAIQFCNAVRRKACVWIEEDEILQTLNNLRKNKFLEATKPDDLAS